MIEIWKPITDYVGYYEVSNLGNVRSIDRVIVMKNNMRRKIKSKTLSQSNDKDGYLQLQLNKNGNGKQFKVHRLVGEAFLPNPKNKPQINHIDGIKTNNHVKNQIFSG